MRAVMRHRVIRVGHRENAGTKGDLLACQSGGVARAVHPFVMMANRRQDALQGSERTEYLVADLGMLRHGAKIVNAQSRLLGQNGLGYRQHANIVQLACKFQGCTLCIRQAEPAGYLLAKLADAPAVVARVTVAGLNKPNYPPQDVYVMPFRLDRGTVNHLLLPAQMPDRSVNLEHQPSGNQNDQPAQQQARHVPARQAHRHGHHRYAQDRNRYRPDDVAGIRYNSDTTQRHQETPMTTTPDPQGSTYPNIRYASARCPARTNFPTSRHNVSAHPHLSGFLRAEDGTDTFGGGFAVQYQA